MLKLTVNGQPREVAEGATLAQLLSQLGADRPGIAVAVNARVVRAAGFAGYELHAGDVVEIIRATAGG
jgi:sulfur carrier protein